MYMSEPIHLADKQAATTTIPQPSFFQKYDTFNTAVTANTNILPNDITVSNTPTGFLRIYATFTLSGTLSLIRTLNGVSVTEKLNGGTALAAASNFSTGSTPIHVAAGETINLQYSATTTCLKLSIVEAMV